MQSGSREWILGHPRRGPSGWPGGIRPERSPPAISRVAGADRGNPAGGPGGTSREAGDELRVPELVPIRYGRMLVSPFSFYRGAALIMAADLASTPNSGLRAQLCGDAHMSNFGVFASPERHLVFDLNDFDETAPGPFQWDVKRLAASLEITGARTATRRSSVGAWYWPPSLVIGKRCAGR